MAFVTRSSPATSESADDRAPALPLTHRATLLSQRDGRHYPATINSWLESGSGLVARVGVREGAAVRLAANHVWLALLTAGHGFAVYSGTARRVADTLLDLSQLEPLAQEHRRRLAPRVLTDEPVTVHSADRPTRHARAVDLSRGGIRLAPLGREPLDVGERVTLDLRLDGAAVVVRGQVARVDAADRAAVVTFDRGPVEHRVVVDRFVLARLGGAPSSGAQATRSTRLARSATVR